MCRDCKQNHKKSMRNVILQWAVYDNTLKKNCKSLICTKVMLNFSIRNVYSLQGNLRIWSAKSVTFWWFQDFAMVLTQESTQTSQFLDATRLFISLAKSSFSFRTPVCKIARLSAAPGKKSTQTVGDNTSYLNFWVTILNEWSIVSETYRF